MIKKIAAVAIFSTGLPVVALDNATMNAAGTVKAYISGSGALTTAISTLFTRGCQANTLTVYSYAGLDSKIFSCTAGSGNLLGVSAGVNVAIQKRDEGGSAYGIVPIGKAIAIPFIDGSTCVGPASGTGTCTGTNNLVPDAGLADEDAQLYGGALNLPPEFSGVGFNPYQNPATFSSIVSAHRVYGVAVNTNLYTALQADQGTNGVPLVSQTSVATIAKNDYPYDFMAWRPLLINTQSNVVNGQVTICRGKNGSGAQVAANRYFLEYAPPGWPMVPFSSGDSNTSNYSSTPSNLLIVESATADGVKSCLTSANSAGGFAIGYMGKDQAETSEWKFVKLNGIESTRENARQGYYTFFFEMMCNIRTTSNSGTKGALIQAICKNAAAPANLNAITDVAIKNSLLTPPDFPACPGVAAPETTFCARSSRLGDARYFPSYY